jgi:hypothetical protein
MKHLVLYPKPLACRVRSGPECGLDSLNRESPAPGGVVLWPPNLYMPDGGVPVCKYSPPPPWWSEETVTQASSIGKQKEGPRHKTSKQTMSCPRWCICEQWMGRSDCMHKTVHWQRRGFGERVECSNVWKKDSRTGWVRWSIGAVRNGKETIEKRHQTIQKVRKLERGRWWLQRSKDLGAPFKMPRWLS